MANKTRLKGTKKNRHNFKAGRRNRSKRKKSTTERKRLKVLAQRLNRKSISTLSDITIIEGV